MTRTSQRPPRVLQLAPSVPFEGVAHAGGRFQTDVDRELLDAGAAVVLLVPSEPSHRRDLLRILPGVLGVDPEQGLEGGRLTTLVIRASARLNHLIRRTPLERIHAPFVLSLLLRPQVRALIRGADVIDLQWFEVIPLAPLLRLLARRDVRIIGTFHDVMSQRLDRFAQIGPADEVRHLRRQASAVRRIERLLVARLDRAVVLSAKDRDVLLDAGAPRERISVLPPRIVGLSSPTAGKSSHSTPPEPPRVIFVGWLERPENASAATWLLTDIWGPVHESRPDAELHLIGTGAGAELRSLAARTTGVHLRGFVDDLDAEYAQAACAVVPLTDGAGVKFKTVEALVHGVPTVATPIGAEGAGEIDDYVRVSEDPAVLADGILEVLSDPSHRERACHQVAPRLAAQHSPQSFASAVREIYGL